jgi:hypothetical protein
VGSEKRHQGLRGRFDILVGVKKPVEAVHKIKYRDTRNQLNYFCVAKVGFNPRLGRAADP